MPRSCCSRGVSVASTSFWVDMQPNVSQGWPRILSSLKTLLETGDILPAG